MENYIKYINQVRKLLDDINILHKVNEIDKETTIIEANIETKKKNKFQLHIIFNSRQKSLVMYVPHVCFVPESLRRKVRSLVNRLNINLVYGTLIVGLKRDYISLRIGHSLEGKDSLNNDQLIDYLSAVVAYTNHVNEEIEKQNSPIEE